MAKTNTQYQVIDGNVIMEYNKICDFVENCQEEEVGQDIEQRSYLLNDSEVAYDAIKSFIKVSKEQLGRGKKVIFTRLNGDTLKEFDDIKSFRDWVNEFFSISKYKFIKLEVVDVEFED